MPQSGFPPEVLLEQELEHQLVQELGHEWERALGHKLGRVPGSQLTRPQSRMTHIYREAITSPDKKGC
jgi:hypothetical protein